MLRLGRTGGSAARLGPAESGGAAAPRGKVGSIRARQPSGAGSGWHLPPAAFPSASARVAPGPRSPQAAGATSRPQPRSEPRLIASYLFFFASEMRIPPAPLPRARFCPASPGGEPAGDPTPGAELGGEAFRSVRLPWAQRPTGTAPAGFPGVCSACSCATRDLRSRPAARGPRAAGTAAAAARKATHPGFVLACRGAFRALGDEVSLFRTRLREAAAFFISQDSLKFRKREREKEGTAKGEGPSEGPRGRIE